MMETTLAAMEHRERNTCEQSCPEGTSGHPCSAKPLAWTAEDDAAFVAGVHLFGKDLALVAQLVGQAEVWCPTLDCDDHCYCTQHPSQAPSSCCWQRAAILLPKAQKLGDSSSERARFTRTGGRPGRLG